MKDHKALVQQASSEMRMYQTAVDRFDEVVVGLLGINRTDGRCLDILDQRGSMTAGELARECGLTTGAMTTLLDRLERLGYLRRVPHPTDRRRVVVEMTDKTRRRIEQIYTPVGMEGRELLACLSDRQLELIAKVMRTGRELLERHAERVEKLPKKAPARPGKAG
ncbi:MAG: MarR family transcriptional regulator [Actinomycetota bacterium]|nr:MarR family transcriptional regulator [Actinomycetota bacterium]